MTCSCITRSVRISATTGIAVVHIKQGVRLKRRTESRPHLACLKGLQWEPQTENPHRRGGYLQTRHPEKSRSLHPLKLRYFGSRRPVMTIIKLCFKSCSSALLITTTPPSPVMMNIPPTGVIVTVLYLVGSVLPGLPEFFFGGGGRNTTSVPEAPKQGRTLND